MEDYSDNEFAIGRPVSIAIQGPSSVSESSTAQYRCISTCNYGPPMDVTSSAKWKSKSKYGKVKKGGLFTTKALSGGDQTCQILVTYGKKAGMCTATLDVTITDDQ